MPLITGPIPGISIRRDRELPSSAAPAADEASASLSTSDADLAEFLQHVRAFDLTLHHEDGSLIATEFIGIQDTERLLALGAECEAHDARAAEDVDLFDADESLDAEEIAGDVEAILDDFDEDEPWRVDEGPADLPRYQLIVELIDERAIP
jgi:hypothetical protein